MIGRIARIMEDKGFGFIKSESGEELFFHRSGCSDNNFNDMLVGDKVTFDREKSDKGPRASNVRISRE